MEKRRRELYPGTAAAEREKTRAAARACYTAEEAPDFIGGKPNYEKYRGISPERVLAFLNID